MALAWAPQKDAFNKCVSQIYLSCNQKGYGHLKSGLGFEAGRGEFRELIGVEWRGNKFSEPFIIQIIKTTIRPLWNYESDLILRIFAYNIIIWGEMLTLKLELAENSTLPTEVHTKVSTTGSDGWVSLTQRNCDNLQIDSTLGFLRSWAVPNLYIGGLTPPSLLKKISQIQLRQITKLKLTSNEIDSLSSIQALQLDSLTALQISNNHVVSLSPLRKLTAPNLAVLILSSNHILTMVPLSQMQLPSLANLFFACYVGGEQCSDVGAAIKLESRGLESLSLWGRRRVKQERVVSRMRGRYKEISVDF